MNIVYQKVGDLIPYENNPRDNDRAVEAVAASIKEFGFKNPIIVDKNNVIVAGDTRRKAAKKLGLEEVPTIKADDLTEEQVRAFRLADNKTAELAEWDFSKLEEELDEVIDVDMSVFGFFLNGGEEDDDDETDGKYTEEKKGLRYEVQGDAPDLSELIDEEKTNELLEGINASSLDWKEQEFLRKAAYRHLAFNYKKIAEYYASAGSEMQELMEKSALVIIDYHSAILNGYTKLSDKIKKLLEDEKNAK